MKKDILYKIEKKLPMQLSLNPVGFVKQFMREETEVEYAEQSKMDNRKIRVC